MIQCNLAPTEILSEQDGRRRLRLMGAQFLALLCFLCVGEATNLVFEADLQRRITLRDTLRSDITELSQQASDAFKAREISRIAKTQRRKLRVLHAGLGVLLTTLPRLVSGEVSLTKLRTVNQSIIIIGCAVYPEAARQLREKLHAQLPNAGVSVDDISVESSRECAHFQLSLTLDPDDIKGANG